MARTVWKFLVPFRGGPRAPVPRHGEVVHCGPDPETGVPAVWIEVDPGAEIEMRQFVAIATGAAVPPGALHRGTAICGDYVWHVYETGEIAVAAALAGLV